MAHYNTIQEAIEVYEKNDINYRVLHKYMKMYNKQTDDYVIVPIDSVISKYRHFLEDTVDEVTMTEVEWRQLRLRPKTVSYRLYGTTELWHALLMLNNCKSTIDFDMRTIKIYNRHSMLSKLNEIMVIDGII